MMTAFQKYIQRYLDLVSTGNLLQEFYNSEQAILEIYSNLNDESALFRYAPEKWSLKEVLQHLIDCERIFQYRALCISRNEQQNLLGFDEEIYAKNSLADVRNLDDLIEEFSAVRTSTKLLFKSFSVEMQQQKGIANGNEVSVETIGKLIAGHNLHHLNIIKERYLPEMR